MSYADNDGMVGRARKAAVPDQKPKPETPGMTAEDVEYIQRLLAARIEGRRYGPCAEPDFSADDYQRILNTHAALAEKTAECEQLRQENALWRAGGVYQLPAQTTLTASGTGFDAARPHAKPEGE